MKEDTKRKDVVDLIAINKSKKIYLNTYACEFAMWLSVNSWVPSLEFPQTNKFIKYRNNTTGKFELIQTLEQKFRKIYKENI